MELHVNDLVQMKKKHPCGTDRFLVLRVGIDLKLRCTGCGHELMTPRVKLEKNIKSVIHKEDSVCS